MRKEEELMTELTNVAIVQRPPALLDRDGTIGLALEYLDEAADNGAQLVVFPEAFVPGYPDWAWLAHPIYDREARSDIFELLLENSVDIEGGDLKPLQEKAAARGTTVVVGVNERSPDSKTSLYNSLVTILADGSIANVHRKLVPTYVERNVWAPGDAAGLKVIDTHLGRIGGLICWENLMPLARFALYAQGVEVYIVSTFDSGDASIASMRHIAREGRCWVVCSGVAQRLDDVPRDFPGYEELYGRYSERSPDKEWINEGDSLIVDPNGEIVAGPMREEHGILYGEIDVSTARRERWSLDAAGHYNRPDIFDLSVNRRRFAPIEFDDSDSALSYESMPADL